MNAVGRAFSLEILAFTVSHFIMN